MTPAPEYQPFALDISTVTNAERDRARAARAFVHAETCPRGHLNPPGCRACPSGSGLVLALRVLDESPRDAQTARRALHDVVCMSGCGPESDHADRTQSGLVAALRRFHTTHPGSLDYHRGA